MGALHQRATIARADGNRSIAGASTPSRARLRQLPENQPEDGVSPRCLDERSVIPEKGWHAGFPAPRVEAVDEVTEWIQGEMLAQRQADPQGARARGPSAVRLMVGKPEQSTVQEMRCEADRPPPVVTRQRLPQHRHVRVITADETLVEWLLEGPHCRRGRTRSRRACSAANGAGLEIHDDTVALGVAFTRIWFRLPVCRLETGANMEPRERPDRGDRGHEQPEGQTRQAPADELR